jgi:hypothetical protein
MSLCSCGGRPLTPEGWRLCSILVSSSSLEVQIIERGKKKDMRKKEMQTLQQYHLISVSSTKLFMHMSIGSMDMIFGRVSSLFTNEISFPQTSPQLPRQGFLDPAPPEHTKS